MTTAHRPTYHSAVGGTEQGGNKIFVPSRQYSAKDLPEQLAMKDRPSEDFSQKNFKQDLLEKENAYQMLKTAMSSIEAIVDDDKTAVKEEKYKNPFHKIDANDENFKNDDDSKEESEESSEIVFLFLRTNFLLEFVENI